MAKPSTYASENIRNIALVGHGISGKTSIAEALLFNAGVTSRLGVAGTGTSVMDFEPEEQKRGSSISTAFAWFDHEGTKVNIIDTPGDGNFIYDAFAAMRGADAVIIVVSAVDGVEVGTERVFNMAAELSLPTVVVINKMDRDRADPQGVLADIEDSLGVKPVPLQVNIGKEREFEGVVSLFQNKALRYTRDGSGRFEKSEVPESLQEAVEAASETLVETVASTDEALLEEYLENFELSEETIKTGFHAALKVGEIVPVLYASATGNIGLQAIADLVVWAVPNPMERSTFTVQRGDREAELPVSQEGPFYGQVVHTFIHETFGKVSIMRVLSGGTPSDGQVLNVGNGESERLGTLYALRGTERTDLYEGVVGDIVAVARLKATHTNDTLATHGETGIVEGQQYPPPMMEYSVVVTGRGDDGKLKAALDKLIEEDPSLSLGYDDLSHRIVLRGMGQAHLDLSVDKMARKFKVQVSTALTAVPYRETLRRKVGHIEGKHKKQTGGAGQFGVCIVDMEPNPGRGFEFIDRIVGGAIPRQYIPSVEKGFRDRMKRGSLAGYPIVDVKVLLKDGKYHAVDSKDVAYQMAGSKAMQAGMVKGGVRLLEPIYDMEIVAPTDNMGDVMGDITRRRGRVVGMDLRGKNTVVKAAAPLAEIQRYAPDLRSMTGGKGSYVMQFANYEEVPASLVDKVVAASPFKRDSDED